jgi:pimeloyl-ACP methyl ester carboxylesterase
MSVVILEDDIVHYEVLGRGRPVIFLHGWVGSWRYWIPSMQSASISFRAYALDLWGFGDSAKNPAKYSISEQTRLLENFLDRLGIGKCALVGHGLGAVIAQDFARKRSESTDRILAISSPFDSSSINPRMRSSSTGVLADWLLGKTPGAEAATIEALKTDLLAINTSLDQIEEWEIHNGHHSLSVPSLFIHGLNDPGIAPPLLNGMEVMQDQTHYIFFDQSGHFPMLDENTKFNRLLIDFLALPSGESPQQLQLKDEWKRRVR